MRLAWYIFTHYCSIVWYKITFRKPPIDKYRKEDPFIYEK